MNGITNITQASDIWELQKENKIINNEDTLINNSPSSNTDEYIHTEKPSPTGIYQLERDKDGTKRIVVDNPKSSEEPTKATEDKKENETCTVNTNKVDSEVKNLKNKITALKQQIAKASDDKQENLKKQLEQLENELSIKDNDSYRRQHSSFSSN